MAFMHYDMPFLSLPCILAAVSGACQDILRVSTCITGVTEEENYNDSNVAKTENIVPKW